MADYYVHLENGSDTGAGTALDPWLTIQKFHSTVSAATAPHDVYIAGSGTVPDIDESFSGQPPVGKRIHYKQWSGQAQANLTLVSTLFPIGVSSRKTFIGLNFNGNLFTTQSGFVIDCTLARAGGYVATIANDTHIIGSRIYGPMNGYNSGVLVRVIDSCIFDWRQAFGGTNYFISAAIAAITNSLFLYRSNTASNGYVLNMGNTVFSFANNTVAAFGGAGLHVYSAMGVLSNNVFLRDAGGITPVLVENLSGGIIRNNFAFGYPRFGNLAYDLGGNTLLTESPYQDWQNLDFTVTKPALIELPAPVVVAGGNTVTGTRYAGCFSPSGGGISWPLIRRIAAMGDLRFSPSGATY